MRELSEIAKEHPGEKIGIRVNVGETYFHPVSWWQRIIVRWFGQRIKTSVFLDCYISNEQDDVLERLYNSNLTQGSGLFVILPVKEAE